jgi:hypothetical protein
LFGEEGASNIEYNPEPYLTTSVFAHFVQDLYDDYLQLPKEGRASVLNNRGACNFYETGPPSPWTFISPIYSLIGLALICRLSPPRHEAFAVSIQELSFPRAGHSGGTERRSLWISSRQPRTTYDEPQS